MGDTSWSQEEPVRMKMASEERYKGKPFLRLVELYVLWCVGALEPEQDKQLRKVEPQLRDVYRRSGSWFEIVAAEMHFGAGLPESLRSNFKRWVESVDGEKSPEAFARMAADKIVGM